MVRRNAKQRRTISNGMAFRFEFETLFTESEPVGVVFAKELPLRFELLAFKTIVQRKRLAFRACYRPWARFLAFRPLRHFIPAIFRPFYRLQQSLAPHVVVSVLISMKNH